MCNQCEMLTINGVACHETGCPNTPRECKWCGETFTPAGFRSQCCSHSCDVSYNNLDCNCPECSGEYKRY